MRDLVLCGYNSCQLLIVAGSACWEMGGGGRQLPHHDKLSKYS